MPRIIVPFILSLCFLVSNVNAGEVSQFVPTLDAPIPISEKLLNGDVALAIISVEYAGQDAGSVEYAKRLFGEQDIAVWEKVHLDNKIVTPPKDMTFLMPRSILRQNSKPYYRITNPSGDAYTCFLMPPLGKYMSGNFFVFKYDTRGRICDMNILEPSQKSMGTGFHYTFEYGNEDDCQQTRIFFRKDEGYLHEGKEIAPGEDVEIGLIEFQYESGKLKKYFNNDSNYFFGPSKTELAYDECGFLVSKAEFNDPNAPEPRYTLHYRNYEQDRFGNWTRRDVYLNDQLRRTVRREIYYVGDPLPDLPEDLTDARKVELEFETEWKMNFWESIFILLYSTANFCSNELFPSEQ